MDIYLDILKTETRVYTNISPLIITLLTSYKKKNLKHLYYDLVIQLFVQ